MFDENVKDAASAMLRRLADDRSQSDEYARLAAAGEITEEEATIARAAKTQREWNAVQPTAVIQAVYDAAHALIRVAQRQPADSHLNSAARLVSAIGIVLRRIADAEQRAATAADEAARAAARNEIGRLGSTLRGWLNSGGDKKPASFLVREPGSELEGWDPVRDALPPLVGIDQPDAVAEVVARAAELINEEAPPERIGRTMALAVVAYLPGVGNVHRLADATIAIAQYARPDNGKPWSDNGRRDGHCQDAERLAVASFRAFGLSDDKANGLVKSQRSSR